MTPDPFDDGEVDIDAAWAQIVANWDGPPGERTTTVPDADRIAGDLSWDGLAEFRARPDDIDARRDAIDPAGGSKDRRAAETWPFESGPVAGSAGTLPGATSTGTGEPTLGQTGKADQVGGAGTQQRFGTSDGGADNPAAAAPPQPDEHPAAPSPTARHRSLGPRDVDPGGPSLMDGLDGTDVDGAGLDNTYEPYDATPPPLPRPTLVTGLAWLGAIGSPVLLLLAALFWRQAPAIVIGLAVVGFVAGFVTLVVRLPDHHDEEDDGAVV